MRHFVLDETAVLETGRGLVALQGVLAVEVLVVQVLVLDLVFLLLALLLLALLQELQGVEHLLHLLQFEFDPVEGEGPVVVGLQFGHVEASVGLSGDAPHLDPLVETAGD